MKQAGRYFCKLYFLFQFYTEHQKNITNNSKYKCCPCIIAVTPQLWDVAFRKVDASLDWLRNMHSGTTTLLYRMNIAVDACTVCAANKMETTLIKCDPFDFLSLCGVPCSHAHSWRLSLCVFFHHYWQIVSKVVSWVGNLDFLCSSHSRPMWPTKSLPSRFKCRTYMCVWVGVGECVCVCVLTLSLCLCSRRLRWVVTMAPFLRIAFNAYDMGVLPPLSDPPICAIKMKESVNTGT